jgi:hypothetical protein
VRRHDAPELHRAITILQRPREYSECLCFDVAAAPHIGVVAIPSALRPIAAGCRSETRAAIGATIDRHREHSTRDTRAKQRGRTLPNVAERLMSRRVDGRSECLPHVRLDGQPDEDVARRPSTSNVSGVAFES